LIAATGDALELTFEPRKGIDRPETKYECLGRYALV
jgi:hypothetical protein